LRTIFLKTYLKDNEFQISKLFKITSSGRFCLGHHFVAGGLKHRHISSVSPVLPIISTCFSDFFGAINGFHQESRSHCHQQRACESTRRYTNLRGRSTTSLHSSPPTSETREAQLATGGMRNGVRHAELGSASRCQGQQVLKPLNPPDQVRGQGQHYAWCERGAVVTTGDAKGGRCHAELDSASRSQRQ
jgi:hypothetical protein